MPCLHMRLHEAPVSQRARSPKSRAHRHFHGARASTACSSTACGLITPSTPRPLSRRRLPRPPLGSSPHALHRRTRLEHRMLSPGGRAWSIAATHTEPSPTASRSAAGQRSTAIRSEARRPHHGQSLSSRAALHSHPLRSPSPALQPIAHAAGQPLHSHPLSSRPLNLMFFHAHRGPPSSPRATSSTTTSIGGRVAPTSCSHTLARRTLSPYLGLRRRGGVGPGGFTLVPPPETSDIREVTAVTCGITALAFPVRNGWV